MPHKDYKSWRAYYDRNKEKIIARERARYQRKKEEISQKNRIYREKNKELVRERKRLYHQKNRAKIISKVIQWQQKNKEKLKAKQLRYHERWKDDPSYQSKMQARSKRGCAKRRARLTIDSTLTAAEWQTILDAHHNRCVYCGKSGIPLTQDHYLPLSRGGQHVFENIVPACKSCNSRKNAKHPYRLF